MKLKLKLASVVLSLAGLTVMAAESSLSDARSRISDVIAKPEEMTKVMSKLSAEDQKAFIGDVNAAIAVMPGSVEKRSVTFLKVDTAALYGAAKGNVMPLVAEVFATVPPESLTLISEGFGKVVFNRNADAKLDDLRYRDVSTNLMGKVVARLSSVDNPQVRAGFAALTMIRASNGMSSPESSDSFRREMASFLASDIRHTALTEWFPAAMGEGQTKTYEPMLGYADAGNAPVDLYVLRLNGLQLHVSLLSHLVNEVPIFGMMIQSDLSQSGLPTIEQLNGGVGAGTIGDAVLPAEVRGGENEPVEPVPGPVPPKPYY